jgi:DNA-binding helix-hairpin-helix protein with protein kinase domain
MKHITFSYDRGQVRQLFAWSTLLLGLFGFIASLMYIIVGERLFVLIEIFSGLALLIFLLSIGFLIFYYLTRPEVRDKRRLESEMDQIHKEMGDAQEELDGAIQSVKMISDRYREQQEVEQKHVNNLAGEIQGKIDGLIAAQELELAAELSRIQKEHLESGLREVPLDPELVPGIGPTLAEKLEKAGISTALDVSKSMIEAIPGFGESKALSLIRWRESFEYKLNNEKPERLPEDTQVIIHEKYSNQILTLQENLADARSAYGGHMEMIHAKEAEEIAGATAKEMSARQRLDGLKTHQQEVQDHLDQFGRITILSLLITILNGGQDDWRRRLFSYLWLSGFIILGIANIALLVATLI